MNFISSVFGEREVPIETRSLVSQHRSDMSILIKLFNGKYFFKTKGFLAVFARLQWNYLCIVIL